MRRRLGSMRFHMRIRWTSTSSSKMSREGVFPCLILREQATHGTYAMLLIILFPPQMWWCRLGAFFWLLDSILTEIRKRQPISGLGMAFLGASLCSGPGRGSCLGGEEPLN